MNRPAVVLRPEPGAAATARAARALGLSVVVAPLFAMEALPWPADRPDAAIGLLAGSAAVFRLGGSGLAALRSLPVHAVGAATARAARAAGFGVIATGRGGLQALVADLPPGRYLRLAGAAHVPLDLPRGVEVDTRVVYAARALPLPDAARTVLAQGAVALLHSGEAARHFRNQCESHGLDKRAIALACLAPRIAGEAGEGWKTVEIAVEMADQALLAIAARMCQTV